MLGAGVDLATDDEGRVHLLGSVWRARFGLDDLPLDMLRVDTGRSHDPTAVRRIRIEGAGGGFTKLASGRTNMFNWPHICLDQLSGR